MGAVLLVGAKTLPWATISGHTASTSRDPQVRVLYRICFVLMFIECRRTDLDRAVVTGLCFHNA
jgi:hypothetical protein